MDEPVDSRAVKRALHALATGETRASGNTAATRTGRMDPIRAATAALEDVAEAAEFVAGGGLDRLRAAVERAERRGQLELAREGQRALATVERFRRAAAGEG